MTAVNDKKTNCKIQISDGRTLSYAEYGVPDGRPVFYFHGFPGSRFDWQLFGDDQLLKEMNARILAPDRPGYGFSDSLSHRTILDWPADVVELADALNMNRFAVLGVSGGGPYAAACAKEIGDRLTATGIVSGMGPSNSPGMKDGVSWTLPGLPGIIRKAILMLTSMGLRKNPDTFLARSRETLAEVDRMLLTEPTLADAFVLGLQEAFRRGIGGADQEARLYTHPWGFDLHAISAQVHLWHGDQDLNVPVSVGRFIAESLPDCRATFLESEGHLTVARNHLKEILKPLLGET